MHLPVIVTWIETPAVHFKVPKSHVAIVGGFKSKTKIIQIG